MKVAIIEYGGNYSQVFIDSVKNEIEDIYFNVKRTIDLFDILAFARDMGEKNDQIVIIADINRKNPQRSAFFKALARLESDTGKMLFKAFYLENESGEEKARETADQFIKYLFKPKELFTEKQKTSLEEFREEPEEMQLDLEKELDTALDKEPKSNF